MEELSQILLPIKQLAEEAGRAIMQIYATDYAVQHKEDRTPLTEADLAAHNIIDAGLRRLLPAVPILSEESAKIPYAERRQWNNYWLVDPLDGTREFIKRNGEFTVNIALIVNGESVLGVVHVPVTGQNYYACRGQGAFRQDASSAPLRLQTRKQPTGKIIVAGSRSHRGDSLNAFLQNIGDYEILSMGSSLKSCLVAEGAADVYARFGPTSEWDTAAAQCIVEEAGGVLTDTNMRQLRYNTKDSLLNPHFFVSGDPSIDWSKYMAS